MGTGTLALIFVKNFKTFYNADFARKSLDMVHSTPITLV